MNQPKRVLIIGYYGDGNAGDEAILTVMLRGLRENRRHLEVIVPSYGPDASRMAERFGVTSFPMQDLDRLLEAVTSADLVLLGGGGLLHDIWHPRPETMLTSEHFGLSYYCGISWLAAQIGKPLMLYAVGVGPLLFEEGRELVRDAARSARIISVRDAASAELLRSLGVTEVPIELTADPAWQLLPAGEDKAAELLDQAGTDGRWLGIAVRNWGVDVDQSRWEDELLQGAEAFAHEHDLGILFLPFQHGRFSLQDDLGLAHKLSGRLSRVRSGVIAQPCTPEDLLAVVGRCEIMIGMRLHAVIFACMAGVPVVALAYDQKLPIHAAALDPPLPVVSIDDLTGNGLQDRLREAWSAREELSQQQRVVASQMRDRAARNSELVAGLLDTPATPFPGAARDRILRMLKSREAGRASASTWRPEVLAEEREEPDRVLRALQPPSLQPAHEAVRIIAPPFFDGTGPVIFGGAERYLFELAKLIRRLGFEVEVLQPTGADEWVREYQGMRIMGVPASNLFEVERTVYEAGGPRPLLTIHLAFFSAGPYTIPPAIGISHGVFWDDPYYHAEDGFTWHRERVLEAIKRLDAVVSVDTNTINWISATSPERARNLTYIPNFVDVNEFHPMDRLEESGLVVLFPRRLVAARGFWLMAEIMPRLLADYPQLEFYFVGHAAGAEEEELRSLMTRYPSRVRWDVFPPERMPQVYQAADIVVIPTLYAEGTSLACLEAQASGKAVVATRIGGLPELILHEYNGLLVEPNAGSVRAAIERLILDDGLRGRVAQKALETAQLFRLERWQERWEQMLRTFLRPRH